MSNSVRTPRKLKKQLDKGLIPQGKIEAMIRKLCRARKKQLEKLFK